MLFFTNISRLSATKLTRIRQAADSTATEATTGDTEGGDADIKVSELRSAVSYLRKEKGIVDLQLELSKQENVRLKAQIEHLTQSLQESRATLAEVRSYTTSLIINNAALGARTGYGSINIRRLAR